MAYRADNSLASLSILVDNIATPVAADVQAMKLVDATAGSGTPIGTAANPLPVSSVANLIGAGQTLAKATINTTASATLITPSAGNRIYVVSYVIVVAAAVSVQFQSATGPANLSGAFPLSPGGGLVVIGRVTEPLFWTAVSDALLITLGTSGVQVSGHYTYFQAP